MPTHPQTMIGNNGAGARAAAGLAWCFLAALFSVPGFAAVGDDPAVVPDKPGGAGLGLAVRVQGSPYRGGGTRNDFMPIYEYEGDSAFLEATRVGLKFEASPDARLDLFIAYRFEGYPYDRIPPSLAGMAERGPGADLGLGYQFRIDGGTLFADLRHDIVGGSNGTEARAGYRFDRTIGRLRLQPQFALAARDANLNNYYYGVRAAEATAARPSSAPGSGINAEVGLSAVYRLTERWRLSGGLSATRWSSGVRASPIVQDRAQITGTLGLAYDFSPEHDAWPEGRPLIVKVLHGQSTDCDVAKVMLARCFSTRTADRTGVTSVELGRPFIERLNGWPVDVVGYLGVLHHEERGLQHNSSQVDAYMKGYFYGLPWDAKVHTRLGFGVGVSYADRVPFVELRDQIARGRNSSRLLNYLDPTIDFRVGDVVGAKSMQETYLGIGVSHRSGIFGTSQLLGNVNGGSNYLYSYLEFRM